MSRFPRSENWDDDRPRRRPQRDRDWDPDDDRPRRPRAAKSRLGLWIGLGVGGGVFVVLLIVLIVILTSSAAAAQSNFTGRWERDDGAQGTLQILEFTQDGRFRQGHDKFIMDFGTYKAQGKHATIRISANNRIGINGVQIVVLEANLLSDNELDLRHAAGGGRYRKTK